MSGELTNNIQKTEIDKQPWHAIELNRNILSIIPELILLYLFCLVIAILATITFDMLGITFIATTVTYVIILVTAGIVSFFVITRWLGTKYYLKSGVYAVVGEFIDPKPGRIHMDVDWLYKSEVIISANDLDTVTTNISFFGRLLGYGHITLQAFKDTEKESIHVLTDLRDPISAGRAIQDMIDAADNPSLVMPRTIGQ